MSDFFYKASLVSLSLFHVLFIVMSSASDMVAAQPFDNIELAAQVGETGTTGVARVCSAPMQGKRLRDATCLCLQDHDNGETSSTTRAITVL